MTFTHRFGKCDNCWGKAKAFMVNQMMRKGIWPFQRVKCKAFCGKAEAISRINISPSTLINHYIKEQLQDEENLILPNKDASKSTNKTSFKLQRPNWCTKANGKHRIQPLMLGM